jgi:nicotinamide riboside kinase
MSRWADNKRLKVIQLFGGPGIGKSTTAADLYSAMKKKGLKVELVHEIAKDLVWDKRHNMFYEQDWIMAQQHQLQHRLVAHDNDYCVIDSSILLGLFYAADDYPPEFKAWCRTVYDSYTNLNIMLKRNPQFPYVQEGRNEECSSILTITRSSI